MSPHMNIMVGVLMGHDRFAYHAHALLIALIIALIIALLIALSC